MKFTKELVITSKPIKFLFLKTLNIKIFVKYNTQPNKKRAHYVIKLN